MNNRNVNLDDKLVKFGLTKREYDAAIEQLHAAVGNQYDLKLANKLILRRSYGKAFKTFLKLYKDLNVNFNFKQLVSIASHDGGSNNIEAVKASSTALKDLGFRAEQIVQLASHDGGSKNIEAVKANFTALKDLGFSAEQIVRLASHIGGSKNIVALLSCMLIINRDGGVTPEEATSLLSEGKAGRKKLYDKMVEKWKNIEETPINDTLFGDSVSFLINDNFDQIALLEIELFSNDAEVRTEYTEENNSTNLNNNPSYSIDVSGKESDITTSAITKPARKQRLKTNTVTVLKGTSTIYDPNNGLLGQDKLEIITKGAYRKRAKTVTVLKGTLLDKQGEINIDTVTTQQIEMQVEDAVVPTFTSTELANTHENDAHKIRMQLDATEETAEETTNQINDNSYSYSGLERILNNIPMHLETHTSTELEWPYSMSDIQPFANTFNSTLTWDQIKKEGGEMWGQVSFPPPESKQSERNEQGKPIKQPEKKRKSTLEPPNLWQNNTNQWYSNFEISEYAGRLEELGYIKTVSCGHFISESNDNLGKLITSTNILICPDITATSNNIATPENLASTLEKIIIKLPAVFNKENLSRRKRSHFRATIHINNNHFVFLDIEFEQHGSIKVSYVNTLKNKCYTRYNDVILKTLKDGLSKSFNTPVQVASIIDDIQPDTFNCGPLGAHMLVLGISEMPKLPCSVVPGNTPFEEVTNDGMYIRFCGKHCPEIRKLQSQFMLDSIHTTNNVQLSTSTITSKNSTAKQASQKRQNPFNRPPTKKPSSLSQKRKLIIENLDILNQRNVLPELSNITTLGFNSLPPINELSIDDLRVTQIHDVVSRKEVKTRSKAIIILNEMTNGRIDVSTFTKHIQYLFGEHVSDPFTTLSDLSKEEVLRRWGNKTLKECMKTKNIYQPVPSSTFPNKVITPVKYHRSDDDLLELEKELFAQQAEEVPAYLLEQEIMPYFNVENLSMSEAIFTPNQAVIQEPPSISQTNSSSAEDLKTSNLVVSSTTFVSEFSFFALGRKRPHTTDETSSMDNEYKPGDTYSS